MFCNQCGKEIADNSKFCNFCGATQNLKKVKIAKKEEHKEEIKDEVLSNKNSNIISKENDDIVNVNSNSDVAVNNQSNKDDDVISCPYCHSKNVQKFSVVNMSGTGTVNGTTIGIGMGGLYGGVVNGTTQSKLAEFTQPPKKKRVIIRFILMCLLMGYISYALITLHRVNDFIWFNNFVIIYIGLLIPIFYAYRGFIFNKKIYPIWYQIWDCRYLCQKCGQYFEFEKNSSEKYNFQDIMEPLRKDLGKWKKQGRYLLISFFVVFLIFIIVSNADKRMNGIMTESGNNKFYYSQNGKEIKDELITYHGDQYYVIDSKVLKKTWKEIDGNLYYFNASGKMSKNKWITYEGNKFHVDKDGKMERSKWIGDKYVGADGKMMVNSVTPDGKRVGEDGKVVN